MSVFKLIAVAKNYIWGGTVLKERFGKISHSETIAEAWELSCHPDGESIIEKTGEKLSEHLRKNPSACGINCWKFSQFPVLVKLIDAEQSLSVQVHPSDEYALKYEGQLGKTEAWYVVEAQPEAFIYYGFKKNTSRAELLNLVKTDKLCDVLNKAPVKRGDVFFIEAGTIHAIGAGTVICEIQQSSNVTYRVYDYGRKDAFGRQRELHIEKALEVIDFSAPKKEYDFERHIAKCRYFTADKIVSMGKYVLNVDEMSFASLVFLEGSGSISNELSRLSFQKGDSIFIEACSGAVTIDGGFEAILTYVE
ncbi:MAG: type I phosphomannose isomerase catalytic subunit [Oscillospiraceae bacterium]